MTSPVDEIDNHMVPSSVQTITQHVEGETGVEQNVYTNHSSSTLPQVTTHRYTKHEFE